MIPELSHTEMVLEVTGYERIELLAIWDKDGICYSGYRLGEKTEPNKQRLRIIVFSVN